MTPPQGQCRWIITHPQRMTPVIECSAPASHYCSVSGSQYCPQHAEDYSDVFGDDSLKEFPVTEAKP